MISWVPLHMNSVAIFLADFGLENLSVFVEINEKVGNLQFFLDRDMGLVLGAPELELAPNLGLGEVIDAPPPPTARALKKRKSPEDSGPPSSAEIDLILKEWANDEFVAEPFNDPCRYGLKGKGKNYQEYAFFEDGLMSSKAVDIIKSGCLLPFSPTFGSDAVDLEAPIGFGFFAKDALHYAVLGTLTIFKDILSRFEETEKQYIINHAQDPLPMN